MKKLTILLILILTTSFSTLADSHLDFTLSDFCHKQPGVQDRDGVYYFPNKEVGITATSICVYKDAYGQYASKGKLINGEMDGWWNVWHENGELKSEEFYKDGKKETICVEVDTKLNSIIYLPNETKPFSGTNLCKYENGQIKSEGNYKDGKWDGKWNLWHENGQIKAEINSKDGKILEESRWHENGQIKFEANFKDYEPHGKVTWWWENGQKSLESYFKNGKKDGKETGWHKNGQKSLEGNYKDGKLDGKFPHWYENGQTSIESNYKNGKCI